MPEYKIGEKEFEQHPLVIGQALQLLSRLKGLQFPGGEGEISVLQVMDILGDGLADLVAIVLIEKGKDRIEYLKTRDVDALADYLRYNLTPDQALEVVADFFTLNQTSLLLQKVTVVLRGFRASATTKPG
jgi:hypothetical protein